MGRCDRARDKPAGSNARGDVNSGRGLWLSERTLRERGMGTNERKGIRQAGAARSRGRRHGNGKAFTESGPSLSLPRTLPALRRRLALLPRALPLVRHPHGREPHVARRGLCGRGRRGQEGERGDGCETTNAAGPPVQPPPAASPARRRPRGRRLPCHRRPRRRRLPPRPTRCLRRRLPPRRRCAPPRCCCSRPRPSCHQQSARLHLDPPRCGDARRPHPRNFASPSPPP